MSVTLQDVAKKAGVYPTLVSTVLNNRTYTRVSPGRRAAIKKIAAEMGYVPNLQASCLRKGKKGFLSVFLPTYEDAMVRDFILGLSETANKKDIPFTLHFGTTPENYLAFLRSGKKLSDTGLITYFPETGQCMERTGQLLQKYLDGGGIVISIASENQHLPCSVSLGFDDRAGSRMAAEYLHEKNCNSCAVISCGGSVSTSRIPSFQERVQELSPGKEVHIYEMLHPFDRDEQKRIADRIFAENSCPFGLFSAKGGDFCNGILFCGAERGILPGKDFFVVAYDKPARYGDYYPIARIHQNFAELGKQTILQFNDIRMGKNPGRLLLSPKLIAGESIHSIFDNQEPKFLKLAP